MSWFRRTAATPEQPVNPAAATKHFGDAGRVPQQGVPLELIKYDAETGQFELGAQALEVLKHTRGPVGVVAVCGRARQGKSFILNQLLGKSGGFQVAPTHRPCTKGLWMWSSPVQRSGPSGQYSLVLLDTEGIDAYDQTGQYSTQIFSLAVLLSSLFVFNQMGGIDEAALDRLSLVTEMTKHIRVRASGGSSDSDASELASFTPSFLWLLRDFYLRLEEDGRQVTPRDYLETALRALPGNGRAVEAKNQIRESIKSLFPDRDCFTLVRPVNDEDELAALDTLDQRRMRPEFREGLARLTQLIFNKAQPKRLGNQILTGPMLAGLVEAYVTAINNGAVPTIATAWQGVAEAESRRAADDAERAYAASFDEAGVPAEEAALEAEHQHALVAAQRVFDEAAVGDESVRHANEERFRQACERRFEQVKEKKLANAALACEKLINDASVRLTQVARQDGATVEQLQQEVARFEATYRDSQHASGPTKWPRFAEFLRDVYGGAVRDLAARQEERQRAQAAQAAAATEHARLQAQQVEARLGAVEGEVTQLRARLAEADRQLAESRAALAREQQGTAQHAARVATLEQQLQQLQQTKEADRASLSQQAESRLEALRSQHQAALAGLTAQQAQSAGQAAELQRQLAAAQGEAETLRRQLTASSTDAQGWAARYNTLTAERDRLQASLDVTATQRAEAEFAREAAVRARDAAERQVADYERRLQAREAELTAQLRGLEEEARRAAEMAAQGAPLRATSPNVPHSPPVGVMVDAVMGDGGSPSENQPDVKKMTVQAMKQWLMDHGQEEQVWQMSSKKAKKADWEAAVRQAL
ncbi:hypothetical protein N2152v2_004650 [Parachlorella kessleri]